MTPYVIYIAGPYRGPDNWTIEQNIRAAETLALEVWRMGAAALCPHTNTRHYQGAAPDEVWLLGDLNLLERCDAVLMTPDWSRSTGARAEHEHATHLGIPILYDLRELEAFVEAATGPVRIEGRQSAWNRQLGRVPPARRSVRDSEVPTP